LEYRRRLKSLGGGFTVHRCAPCDAVFARAEALRLLAECGKVGRPEFGYGRMGRRDDAPIYALRDEQKRDAPCRVSFDWFEAADALSPLTQNMISGRLRLLDAYAAADPDTRRRWAEETRALTPQTEGATA
jgi:predicted  nucleic acid-binding Zn-ribbon protein